MELSIMVIIGILLINLVLLVRSFQKDRGNKAISSHLAQLEQELAKLESSIRDDFARSRQESFSNAKISRSELAESIHHFSKSQHEAVSHLTKSTEERLEFLREVVEKKLEAMQADNNLKLEKMRLTVDEKLHKTLEERLGDSFKLVSERLEQVHQGLGEMQNLANGVGDLKRVLANVKTRGVLGEIQLENILEQILTENQYDKNVATKQDSRDRVEFALKLPGKERPNEPVYLPIDAKFPLSVYYSLLDAYDKGDAKMMEEATKNLENVIKKCAKDIKSKYIDPPRTTDFAILFLPIEGLYAEVVRRTDLLEILQRDYKINISGPTTLAALLNSLQMGFKTLAIERRSSEVWDVLAAVKTEFEKFGTVLGKTQERLNLASQDLDSLVGVRTRQIQRKLRDVHSLPNPQMLAVSASSDEDGEDEEI